MSDGITLQRRKFLSTAAVIGSISMAGCTGTGNNLEIVDESYSYAQSEARGTWRFTVENTGETTNVVARVDLVSTVGEDEGDVVESYDRTGIIEEGETEIIRVENAHYLNTNEYEFSREVKTTDRPHATFNVNDSSGPEIEVSATGSESIGNSISTYEWSAREHEWVESGDSLNWDIPNGEVVEFTPPDPNDYFANIVLTVTDEEGQTDIYHGESVSDRSGFPP